MINMRYEMMLYRYQHDRYNTNVKDLIIHIIRRIQSLTLKLKFNQ